MSEFTLKQKLDMWQRTAIGEAPTNVTIIPEYVVELHNDVKELYDRIAELKVFIDQLIEAGEKMQALVGWSTGDEATKDWDALVKDWKKEAR